MDIADYKELVLIRLYELNNRLAHTKGKIEIDSILQVIVQNELMIMALDRAEMGYPMRYNRPPAAVHPNTYRNAVLAVSA